MLAGENHALCGINSSLTKSVTKLSILFKYIAVVASDQQRKFLLLSDWLLIGFDCVERVLQQQLRGLRFEMTLMKGFFLREILI